ncbi:MAG: hypothetical protein JXA57_07215 [Armatimonadetes bacterium]|nr:hypothetical protein [Armatimonadota bacterium]
MNHYRIEAKDKDGKIVNLKCDAENLEEASAFAKNRGFTPLQISQADVPINNPATINETAVKCQQCGGIMHKDMKADKSMALQVVGVLLFLVGVGLLVVIPFGTIAGLIIMIVSARLGYSKKKVWLCRNCGYFFERAK